MWRKKEVWTRLRRWTTAELDAAEAMDEEVPVRSYSYQELEHRARNEELPRAAGPRRTRHKGDEKPIV
jgi:hypothetical protein